MKPVITENQSLWWKEPDKYCLIGASIHGSCPPDGTMIYCVDQKGNRCGPLTIFIQTSKNDNIRDKILYEMAFYNNRLHGPLKRWLGKSLQSIQEFDNGEPAGYWKYYVKDQLFLEKYSVP